MHILQRKITMAKRYQQQGEYYIKDTITNKTISYRETVDLLNHQERIIQGKTDLIEKMTGTMKGYEKTIKGLEEDNRYYKDLFKKLIG